MNFIESLKTCVLKKYFNYYGRASRSEFWYFNLFFYAVIFLTIYSLPYIESFTPQKEFSAKQDFSNFALIFIIIFSIAMFFPAVSVTVRRLHDIGQSGYWVLTGLGFIVIGKIPFFILPLFGLLGGIINLIILIICIKDGDKKDNKFGKNIYKRKK